MILNLKIIGFLFLLIPVWCRAQDEKSWIKNEIVLLSDTSFHGRGYINNGVGKAAVYLAQKYHEFGLIPFEKTRDYFQDYKLTVNTFPGDICLSINKKRLQAGKDYLVNAASPSYNANKLKLKTLDLSTVRDSVSWFKIKGKLKRKHAYFFKSADTLSKYLKSNIRRFGNDLPGGLYLVPQHGKITWTVARDTIPATIFYVEDTVLPKRMKRVSVNVDHSFVPDYTSQNVLGYVPGKMKTDSFIVFTAHFDHLGQMGKATVFPGAHDNASGTSLMLYLARHFAANPQQHNIAFIAFSGEEAGLVGSKYYTDNPVFPLNSIKFVINLDMTGDATNGITVVNAIDQKKAFALLNEINDDKKYLPKINERDQSRNSDHFHFSEKGVPAIFIYGNGTKPFYHDIFDQAKELNMENIDGLVKLLIDFVGKI
jgi:aminopeptidase YwaD